MHRIPSNFQEHLFSMVSLWVANVDLWEKILNLIYRLALHSWAQECPLFYMESTSPSMGFVGEEILLRITLLLIMNFQII